MSANTQPYAGPEAGITTSAFGSRYTWPAVGGNVLAPAGTATTRIVERLDARARGALVDHFVELSIRDRRLRFGIPLARTGIASYVERIDFDRDAVLGVGDAGSGFLGVTHIALVDGVAELGLSVVPSLRNVGLGSAMFEEAVAHARTRGASRVYVRFLVENVPVLRLARRFGMQIVLQGDEADGWLELTPMPLTATVAAGATAVNDDALDAAEIRSA